MASSGPNSAALGASDSTVGAVAWSTPTNIYTSNDARATAALNNQQSQYLKATTFSFAIPGGAVIDGIKVEIEKSRTAGTGTLSDTTVKLVKRGVIVGQNRASQGAAWTGTDAYSTYGDTIDTWGSVWTPSEVNAYDFGVVFSCTETASLSATAGVDHVRITVYYTDGFVSGAQVQDASEVILYGQRYRLAPDDHGHAGRVNVTLATSFPPKMDIGNEFSRPSNPIVESYVVDDLRGGMGLWNYRTPADLSRYWTGESFDGLTVRSLTLGPLLNTTGAFPVNPTSADGFRTSTLIVVTNAAGQIYNYTPGAPGSWSALTDTLPGNMDGAPVFFNKRLFLPMEVNGYSYLSSVSGVATDVAPGASNPEVLEFVIWDGRLWAIDWDYILWVSSTGNSGSWSAKAQLPARLGVVSELHHPMQLLVFDDANGESVIWALIAEGQFLYDAVNDKWIESRLTHYDINYVFTVGGPPVIQKNGIVFQGSLYIKNQDRDLTRLLMSGGSLVVDPNAGPFYPDGVPSLYSDTAIAGYTTNNKSVFIGLHTRTGDVNARITVLGSVGQGWHPIWTATSSTRGRIQHLNIITTSDGSKLYLIGDANGGATAFFSWFDVDKFEQSALHGTREYNTTGNVELPVFSAWNLHQTKIAQQCRIKLTGAGTTETVQLAYRINGSTGAYTNIGSPIAVNEEVNIPLGTNNTGIAFQSWQWKWTLASAGSTAAPKIEHITLDYVRKEEVQRGFQVNLDLSTSYFGRTPQQMLDDIWVHMKAESWGTFAYKDDADDTRSYLVKVMRPGGEEGTGGDTTGRYSLFLVEMGPN